MNLQLVDQVVGWINTEQEPLLFFKTSSTTTTTSSTSSTTSTSVSNEGYQIMHLLNNFVISPFSP